MTSKAAAASRALLIDHGSFDRGDARLHLAQRRSSVLHFRVAVDGAPNDQICAHLAMHVEPFSEDGELNPEHLLVKERELLCEPLGVEAAARLRLLQLRAQLVDGLLLLAHFHSEGLLQRVVLVGHQAERALCVAHLLAKERDVLLAARLRACARRRNHGLSLTLQLVHAFVQRDVLRSERLDPFCVGALLAQALVLEREEVLGVLRESRLGLRKLALHVAHLLGLRRAPSRFLCHA
eukprot:6188822-Pleurochrysis_carterae.AAC.2